MPCEKKIVLIDKSEPGVIFTITFLTMNRHTCKLFENILNDDQTKGNGEINTA